MSPIEGHSGLVSVIVPVYGSEQILPHTYERLSGILSALPDLDYEIVFVNDGSPDGALYVLRSLASADPKVKVISLSRNFGHQVAISAGLDAATGDAVVVIDDDLQDPPEVIAEMVALWREGYEVVYGQRTERKGEGSFKRASASVFYRFLSWLSDTPLPLDTGDFRLMDRRAANALRSMREESRYVRGMVAWTGFRQTPLPYSRDPRHSGRSNYNLKRLLGLAYDGIVSFSSKPLVLAGRFGALVTLLAFIYSAALVTEKLMNPATLLEGWTSVVVIVMFLGGVQLMSIGLLGAYLSRIFYETKRRPLYLVSETHNLSEDFDPIGRA
ncbi:MAG TPA: glycosyltransferase family 2 protein [Coriobacteriia bacterium]|nr:glycosyltransferase family 2 protein [Coriobacteriia bacterium]